MENLPKPNYIHEDKRVKDYVFGAATGVPFIVINPSGDWRPYLSNPEKQSNPLLDSMECVTFAQALRDTINLLITQGTISGARLQSLITLGYVVNGKFDFNEIAAAKMNGTTNQGNSFYNVLESTRKNGLVPQSAWLNVESTRTWEALQAKLPQKIIDMGKQLLSILNVGNPKNAILWEWVLHNEHNPQKIIDCLKTSSVQIATAICFPWNTTQTIQPCGQTVPVHSTRIIFADVPNKRFCIRDSYEPFEKWLSFDYPIENAVRCYINLSKPTISLPIPFYHTFYTQMGMGDDNMEVFALNSAMKSIGLYTIIPNTVYNEYTRIAVKAYQILKGITHNNGVRVGPQTLKALIVQFSPRVKGDDTPKKTWYNYAYQWTDVLLNWIFKKL